jgi:hypothetical protein
MSSTISFQFIFHFVSYAFRDLSITTRNSNEYANGVGYPYSTFLYPGFCVIGLAFQDAADEMQRIKMAVAVSRAFALES